MQNESYVKHQHVPVVRPVWKLVFLLVMKILEGARALVSSSLDQLLQAFLGRGHLCPWLCLKCHLPSGCICSRLAQSLTRPKKRGRLSQVRTPDFTSWNWVSWKKKRAPHQLANCNLPCRLCCKWCGTLCNDSISWFTTVSVLPPGRAVQSA